jgi:hypothetical protein
MEVLEENVVVVYGCDTWCASREKCKQHKFCADKTVKCYSCDFKVHIECSHVAVVDGIKYSVCSWCTDLSHIDHHILQQHQDNNNSSMSDSYDIIITNDHQLYNKEETILFQQLNEALGNNDNMVNDFPTDSSVIPQEGSFLLTETHIDELNLSDALQLYDIQDDQKKKEYWKTGIAERFSVKVL